MIQCELSRYPSNPSSMPATHRPQLADDNNLSIEDVFMKRSAFKKTYKDILSKLEDSSSMKHEYLDEVDAKVPRNIPKKKPGNISRKRVLLDMSFALGGIITFVADIVTDALVAKQYYENNDILWFSLTCIFIVLPSLVMQIFSCYWFKKDSKNHYWWNYLVHLLQLGTMQRYMQTFWDGISTLHGKLQSSDYYSKRTPGWRDVCLLRLFEGFLEAAPQMILQLYILTIQNEFIAKRDWLTATSAVVSVISLACALASYSQMLRLCRDRNSSSYVGQLFHVLYLLLMVASRVVALVLFASAFKYYIFVVFAGHSAIMFGWLCCMDTDSRSTALHNDRNDESHAELFLDKVFTLIISIIYFFCFLKVHQPTTKTEISLYYAFVFIETGILMTVWYPYRTLNGALMYAAFGLVFGGQIFGLVIMSLYYQYFHPKNDITPQRSHIHFDSPKSANTNDLDSNIEDVADGGTAKVEVPIGWTARVGKRTLLNRVWDESGLLESKTELASLQFIESTGKKSDDSSKTKRGGLCIDASWNVESCNQEEKQGHKRSENFEALFTIDAYYNGMSKQSNERRDRSRGLEARDMTHITISSLIDHEQENYELAKPKERRVVSATKWNDGKGVLYWV